MCHLLDKQLNATDTSIDAFTQAKEKVAEGALFWSV
jgi:hypothetical protein